MITTSSRPHCRWCRPLLSDWWIRRNSSSQLNIAQLHCVANSICQQRAQPPWWRRFQWKPGTVRRIFRPRIGLTYGGFKVEHISSDAKRYPLKPFWSVVLHHWYGDFFTLNPVKSNLGSYDIPWKLMKSHEIPWNPHQILIKSALKHQFWWLKLSPHHRVPHSIWSPSQVGTHHARGANRAAAATSARGGSHQPWKGQNMVFP